MIPIDERTLADVEMISNGGFAPLRGFLDQKNTQSVLRRLHLVNGALWPIPIVLPISDSIKKHLKRGSTEALTFRGKIVASIRVDDIFLSDKTAEAKAIFGTTSTKHPGVAAWTARDRWYVGGKLTARNLPKKPGLEKFNLTPRHVRAVFKARGWKTIVAFQTRNPMHRAHEDLTKEALKMVDGLYIHPLVGVTKAGDIPAAVRMKTYDVLVKNYYSKSRVLLSINPAAMHYAGPREAVLHALIQKNYGCTHFIVGRDHAGVGKFYGPYAAQALLRRYKNELGITSLFFKDRKNVSGTRIRALLNAGKIPPPELMRPDVAKILLDAMK